MKFLHTADVHIGAGFKGLGNRGKEQRRQIRETFKKVIDTALSEKVDLVLIAGDLFDSNLQGQDDTDLVIEQFKRLKDIPVCLIGGTHDLIGPNSVLKKCRFNEILENAHLLDKDKPFMIFNDLELTVYGVSLASNKGRRSPLKDLPSEGRSKFNIAMVHGSYDTGRVEKDDWVFSSEEIESSGLNYLACGHWHSYFEIPTKKTKALYPGSPEWIAIDQTDSGNIVIVQMDASGSIRTEKRKIGKRRYEKLVLDADKAFSGDALKIALSKKTDPDLIMDVEISGMVDLEIKNDLGPLFEELEDKFFRLRFVDNSHIKLGEIDPSKYPENVTIGKFVRLMQEKIRSAKEAERSIAEESLELGVALLSGKEVLK
jgi:exonuclease SbcD